MKNNIFTIIILTFFVFSASAQKGKIKKGEKFFGAYSFDRAIEKLEGITDKTTSINRQLADSYFKIGDFEKSESYYATIINATDKTAEDVYQYASVLQINKKYNEADVWMKKFNQLNPTDQRGIDYKNKPGFYKRLSEDPGQFSIRNLDINTPQSDFGTAYYLNKIVFASSREGIIPIKKHWN